MTNTPAISIVLPTYNGSRYIRQSIESCLDQTFRDFELIIVNDCSTDNTLQIIEEYAAKDPRISFINNTVNQKLPQSLNNGFNAAKGKYFTWTSDDNYYKNTALETLVTILENDSSLDLVYTNYTLVDENGKAFGERIFNNVYDNFTSWLGCGACFLYKSEIHFLLNGYNPGAFLIEDYDFFVRAFLKFNFKYLPDTDLYFYREHPSSLTSTQSSVVNDLAKIFLERQISGLAQKLPANQMALVYRKFVIYNAVQKNNYKKSLFYLEKLLHTSKKQTIITLIYIPLKKTLLLFAVVLHLYWGALGLLFKKSSPAR